TEIFEYRTFYGVLQAMARDLRGRGVTHVVMEASGVYTDPVYYALAEQDFEQVAVVNPAHARALRGYKTDAADCRRLAEAVGCGPRARSRTCRWRWPAGSAGITRCCAGCTGTGSPSSTRPSPGWTGRSRAGPGAGSGSWTCSRPSPRSAT